ncbi:MAG: 50S ribosomal protein L6 [Nanoarchaeota archaeon]|nr:50S ribosomal protein L6 [Nanoarchaeota archaeon]
MVKKDIQETVKLPAGVKVSVEGTKIHIQGPKGKVTKNFDNPNVEVKTEGGDVILSATAPAKKVKAVLNSYKAHLKNAFIGVVSSYAYKLKICSGHFPMTVAVSGQNLVIKNFLGEKVPRQVALKSGVSVKVDGAFVLVDGPDKDLAGQVAADIEQSTRRPGFDRRIFQDGIYIIEKAGKEI